MSAGMCIAILVSQRIFRFGRVLWSHKWIFLFGRVWQSCNKKASHGQINGSNEMMLGTPLGGTVLFLPVRWEEAETIYRHPTLLGKLAKYCTLGGCCGLTITWRRLTEGLLDYCGFCHFATLGGCVTVIGNGLDLAWSERWLPLQWQGWPHCYDLDLDGFDGALFRSKTRH